MTTDTAVCKHCGELIEPTGGKLYLWTHVDGDQQKCTVARPVDKGKLLQEKLDSEVESMFTAVNKIYAANVRSLSDWERGYAKGYARALEQLCELVEGRSNRASTDELVRECADKLRKQVGQDA